MRSEVSEELDKMIERGIIEKVELSKLVSNIVVVKKKSGKIRICVDFRLANKAIILDSHPISHVEDLLSSFKGARYFSKLDMSSAYHQVNLHEESHDLTTFVTHEGLFRFKPISSGLASA